MKTFQRSGRPTNPISATTFNSRVIVRVSPCSPSKANPGAFRARRGKGGVAEPAATTLCDDNLASVSRQVRDWVPVSASVTTVPLGTGRMTSSPRAPLVIVAAARLAAGRTPMCLPMVVDQSRQSVINTKDHRAAIPAITAVGTAERLELFTMNGGAAIAAVAAVHVQA